MYGDVVVDSSLLEKLYLNAKDTLIVDNQKLVLETELYRDFFPGVTPINRRLIAPIYIASIDSLLISNNFEIKTLYVINKEQIWISNPKPKEDNYMPIFKICRISKDGPEWETNIYVDVVVEIKDLNTSRINYLIARKQLIAKIE